MLREPLLRLAWLAVLAMMALMVQLFWAMRCLANFLQSRLDALEIELVLASAERRSGVRRKRK